MEGTIAEINLFAGNFAPKSWAFCQGQTISIASNTALFSLLGTTYGGNGTTTFQLPNLSGRVAIGAGSGPGLTPRSLGEMGGTPTTTLTVANLPVHTHGVQTVVQVHANATANGDEAANAFWGQSSQAIYGTNTDTQLAVTPASKRETVSANDLTDSGEEIATLLWSYAAAKAMDLPLEVVFHSQGYKGSSDWLIETFESRNYMGLPLLEWMGLTAGEHKAKELGIAPFPNMIKWLRD